MTTFLTPWGSTFESQPADNEDASLGASRIRATKAAVSERMKVDHSWIGDKDDGKHLRVTLPPLSGAPVTEEDDGVLYAKLTNARTELFFKDSAGAEVRITTGGALNAPAFFGTGTKMLFLSTVPAGWAVDGSLADRVPLISASTPGVVGGSWAVTGLATGGTALTIDQIPSHTHSVTVMVAQGTGEGPAEPIYKPLATGQTGAAGGNNVHTHSVTSNSTWRPLYVTVVPGIKQ